MFVYTKHVRNILGNNVLDRFEDGLAHAERLRQILPPVYNSARLNEQPVPSINAMINIREEVEDNCEDLARHSETIETNDNEEGNGLESMQNDALNENIGEKVQIERTSETDDVKIEQFQEVVMEPEDLNAIDNLFSDADEDIEQSNSTLDEQSVNGEEDTSSSSIECIFESLDDFRPMVLENGYFIKPHDILSNNIPFKTNVSLFFFPGCQKSVCF